MRFDVVTLFPELFAPFLAAGVTRRAYETKQVDVRLWQLRDFSEGNYRRVDVDFHSVIASALGDAQRVKNASFAITADASAPVVRADGSTVDVDAESAKLAANALEHQALVAISSGRGDIYKIALGVK